MKYPCFRHAKIKIGKLTLRKSRDRENDKTYPSTTNTMNIIFAIIREIIVLINLRSAKDHQRKSEGKGDARLHILHPSHLHEGGSSTYSQEQTKKTRCQCGKSEQTDAKHTQDKGQVPFHINIDEAGRRTERAEGKPSGKEKDENNEKPSISRYTYKIQALRPKEESKRWG